MTSYEWHVASQTARRAARGIPCSLATRHTPLPTSLAHSGNHPGQCQFAEANSAKAKPSQVRARPAAATAAVVRADLELRLTLRFLDPGLLCHAIYPEMLLPPR